MRDKWYHAQKKLELRGLGALSYIPDSYIVGSTVWARDIDPIRADASDIDICYEYEYDLAKALSFAQDAGYCVAKRRGNGYRLVHFDRGTSLDIWHFEGHTILEILESFPKRETRVAVHMNTKAVYSVTKVFAGFGKDYESVEVRIAQRYLKESM